MNAIWSQDLFEHARTTALAANLNGAQMMMDEVRLNNLIGGWAAPGPVDPDDVRMVVALALLGPAGHIGPPQHLRDWLLDCRIRVRHAEAPPFESRVRDVVVAFGLSQGKGCWAMPTPPLGDPEMPAIITWGTSPMWENARVCLSQLYLKKAVDDVDHVIHSIFPDSHWPPYLPDAPEWLSYKMIGLEQQIAPGTRLEICGRAGRTEFQIAKRLASPGASFTVKLPNRVPVKWVTSGANRQLAGDVKFVWSPTPPVDGTVESLVVWDGEAARIGGSAFDAKALNMTPLKKPEALEIRGATGGLEVWVVKQMEELHPAVRRVFTVRNGACLISAPNWQRNLAAGASFFVLAQDVGCELYINGIRARSLDDHELLVVDTQGTLFQDPCSCGWVQCGTKHRIYGWDPYVDDEYISLHSFTASAVKGPAR